MISKSVKNEILKEQAFPHIRMSLEERNFYLSLIRNCKDICDTRNRISGTGRCNIIELKFEKTGDMVRINGVLTIGSDSVHENRCISGFIYRENSSIIVEMNVVRLCSSDKIKEYSVIDKFYLDNEILKRESKYNYTASVSKVSIKSKKLKGRFI